MPVPSCNPNSVSWSGVENGHGEDRNNPLGAYTAALTQAENAAGVLMGKFEAQGCPTGKDGCPQQSNVRGDPVVAVPGPIQRQPVKGKGIMWVCDLTYAWSDTIFCYKTPEAKKAADDEREKARLAREKKAREEGK